MRIGVIVHLPGLYVFVFCVSISFSVGVSFALMVYYMFLMREVE